MNRPCGLAHRGVPVRIVKDDGVGRREVDAEAAGARGQEEDEQLGLCLPVGDHVSPLGDGRVAVEAEVLVLAEREILLKEVDHASHLEVDEAAVPFSFELREQRVELGEFARVEDQLLQLRNLHRRQGELSQVGDVEDTLRRETGHFRVALPNCRERFARGGGQTEERGMEKGIEPFRLVLVCEGTVAAVSGNCGGDGRIVVEAGVWPDERRRFPVGALDSAQRSQTQVVPRRNGWHRRGLIRDDESKGSFVLLVRAADRRVRQRLDEKQSVGRIFLSHV